MPKKPATKATAKTTKNSPAPDEQIVLSPESKKALKLVDKSAKVRAELEEAVTLAIEKAVRKCMKENNIALTRPEAVVLAAIWFGNCE